MKLTSSSPRNFETEKLDLLVFGVHEAKDARQLMKGQIQSKALAEGFKGKPGEVFFTHTFLDKGPKAIALIGLGDRTKVSQEHYRKVAAMACKIANTKQAARVGIFFDTDNWVKSASEGAVLSAYRFDKYLSEKDERHLSEVVFFTDDKQAKELLRQGEVIAEAVCLARDLINEGPSVMNPVAMAKVAMAEGKAHGLDVKVFDEKMLEKENFGLLLAVGRGSSDFAAPRVVRLAYRPAKKAKKHIALIGKGVTFDSGGLDIKPSDGMLHMKTDMSGAASVLAAIRAIAQLKPNVAVTAYMACVENGVDSKSYHPGDIITSRKGLSVEINNTDAEGRLVLADTMNYAQEKDKPDVVIDIATLTGACVVALGPNMAGLFSNDDALSSRIMECSQNTGESFWRMPMPDELFDQLKTPIADMKNTGERYGGAITAALFLQKFIEPKVVWAHLDIAGPARNDKDQPYISVGGSGFGVRTLIELVQNWA
ncbi:MAG: leucyl aminopeptidase [Myxococcota bacterium]